MPRSRSRSNSAESDLFRARRAPHSTTCLDLIDAFAYSLGMIGSETKPLSSEAVSNGIRVQVVPSFMDSHSDAERGRFIFSYKIRISNEGTDRVRLVSRTWQIVDADGTRNEVSGPGVVGQHPELSPGETFEYSSFCPLPTAWGTMEGHYVFEREDKSTFEAQVARFYFAAPTA